MTSFENQTFQNGGMHNCQFDDIPPMSLFQKTDHTDAEQMSIRSDFWNELGQDNMLHTTDRVSFATGFKPTHNIQQESKPFVLAEGKQINVQLKSAQQERISKVMTASSLGSQAFKKAYNLKYAYVCGAMSSGITSTELVIKIRLSNK
jgi:hypothetical protein